MSQGLCPGCGAAVDLSAGQNETKCQYCDSVFTLQQAETLLGEARTLKFAGTLLIADTSREGGSYEEAISFYNKIIEQEPTFVDAWLNKGICMLQSSKIGDLKTTEAISSWKAAIKFAKNADAMKKRVAKEIGAAVTGFYPVLESHYREFSTLDNSYAEFVSRFLKLENALAVGLELSPSNPDICTAGINLCNAVLSAATAAGMANAGAALLNKDWKGALTSAVGGAGAASTMRRPVEELKIKYQRALAKIDPNYKAPDLPAEMPSAAAGAGSWKEACLAPLRAIRVPGDVLLHPVSTGVGVFEKAMDDLLAFLSPTETRADVLLFENNFITINSQCILVTTNMLGWGQRGQPKKGFFSPAVEEKKVVIPAKNVLDVVYARPGMFDSKEPRPVIHYRNAFGVRESVVLPTGYFKMHQQGIGGLPRHERAEAIVQFLKNWASGR